MPIELNSPKFRIAVIIKTIKMTQVTITSCYLFFAIKRIRFIDLLFKGIGRTRPIGGSVLMKRILLFT